MKASKISFPSSGYRSPLLSYWAVVVLTAFLFAYTVYRIGFGIFCADTPSYYAAGESLFNGVVDDIRPPVYPVILHTLKAIFGFEGSMIAVTILQTIVFVISVAYVNKSIRLVASQSPRLCFWVTILYVLLQIEPWHCLWWVVRVQSDAFSIYCSAFLAYCLIRAAQSGASARYAIWSSVWLLLLVFLRPVLVCYVPVASFFWILLYLESRRAVLKKCLTGLGGVIVVVALLGAYCYELNRRYHIHSVSFVGSVNNYAMLRYGGIITPDDTDNPVFKEFLEQQIAIKEDSLTYAEQWEEMNQIFSLPHTFHPIVEQAVSHAIKSNPKEVARTIYQRYNEVNDKYVSFINMLLFVVGGVIVAFYCKYRKISPVPWTLFLFVVSLWASMFIGAMHEWQRLSAPITPMLALVVGWGLSVLRVVPQECKPKANDYETK